MLIPTDWGAGRGACTAILGCRWGRGQCLLMDMACFFFSGVMWDPTWAWDAPAKLRLRWVYRWVTLEIYRDELYLKCTWMSYTWNVHGLAAIPEMYTDELYLKYTQRSYTRNVHRWAALLCELCKVSSYRNTHWFHSQGGVSSRGKESLVNSEGSTMITKLQKWNNQSYFLTCFCLYHLI